MEQPVTFQNVNGFRLFGMLYHPDPDRDRRTGIVVSVNAIKYRAGTFGLHVRLARQLARCGYTVLTFDPEGIGDSEGAFDFKPLTEHYFDIQTGKYNKDLKCAIDRMHAEPTVDRIVLVGLCGGAISVLTAGAGDARVAGMVLLNIPVLVEDLSRQGRDDNAGKITSSEAATTLLKSKFARLAQREFWGRLLRLQVDFREEWSLVRRGVYVLLRKSVRSQSGMRTRSADVPVSKHRLFNMNFQRAYFTAVANGKSLFFLFAEHDPWTWIFKSEFQDIELRPGHPNESHCEVRILKGANHIFSAADSQAELFREVATWLRQLT